MEGLVLGSLSAANMILLLMIQVYTVASLGLGRSTDAVFASLAFAQFILNILNTIVASVVVPLLAVRAPNERRRTAWDLFIVAGLAAAGIAIVAGFSAPLWVPLLLPGFTRQDLPTVVALVRIQMISVVGGALAAAAWGACRAFDRFYWGELATAAGSLVALAYVAWQIPHQGADAAAWGFVLRTAIPPLLMMPIFGPLGQPRLRATIIAEVWSRTRPLLVGASFYKVTILVDRFLASLAPAGGLSLLAVIQQLFSAWEQIMARSITLPAVPALARTGDRAQAAFEAIRRRLFLKVGVISLAGFVLTLLVGPHLLSAILGLLRLPQAIGNLALSLMAALGGQWVGSPLLLVVSSSYHALGDTRTPAIVAAIGVPLGIALRIVGFLTLNLIGLALGISAYYIALLTLYGRYSRGQRMEARRRRRTPYSDA